MKAKSSDGPFNKLEKLVKDAGLHLGKKPEEVRKIPIPIKETSEATFETEEEMFSREMEGVLRPHFKVPVRQPLPPPVLKDAEAENQRLMESALAGDPALRVSEHPEYIEGWVGVSAKKYLPGLRSGMYSIQGQIDLHGLSRDEARRAVEEFVERMSRFRPCCVKIIHGRGINSPKDRAILKESLQRWLATRRLGRHVVAYASAPLNDGGVGAIYVLLRARS